MSERIITKNKNLYQILLCALILIVVATILAILPACDGNSASVNSSTKVASSECLQGNSAELAYTVKDDLNFDNSNNITSDNQKEFSNKITNYVEDGYANAQKIYKQCTLNIVDFGAQSHATFATDPTTYKKSNADAEAESQLARTNTRAIVAALRAASEAGGGTVVVPNAAGNVFYTAAIHMESNVNLYIEEGATLKFTTDTSLYVGDLMRELYGDEVDEGGRTFARYEGTELYNYSPFVYAYGKQNIAITGKGTIDGQCSKGDGKNPDTMVWYGWSRELTYSNGVKINAMTNARNKLMAQGQNCTPVSERKYGEATGIATDGADDGFMRPNFVQPYNCQGVYIQGINVANSPMWEINPVLCDCVLVDNLNINTHLHNNDGCDPECTSNCVIRNNIFDTGDDCIAIKAGRNADALRINRPTYNLVISNNTFKDGHGGITIGSEISSGVKNVFSYNNTMSSDELEAAYRFKTNYIRGGFISNIFYNDDNVLKVKSDKPVVLVDLNYYIDSEVKSMEDLGVSYWARIPQFSNLCITGLHVNTANTSRFGGKEAMQLIGFSKDSIASSCQTDSSTTDCYVGDITIKNSEFYNSGCAFNAQYVDGLTLDNVVLSDMQSKSTIENCKNFTFTNCKFNRVNIDRNLLNKIENFVEKNFNIE